MCAMCALSLSLTHSLTHSLSLSLTHSLTHSLPPSQNLVPGATLEEHRGREMRFLLPLHQARPHTLSLLFSQLETQANEMGVASYGLTACSMEEIFVQLTHKEAAEAQDG